jgi:hypothetical protein
LHAINRRASRRESKHEPRQPACKDQEDKQSNPSAFSGTPRLSVRFSIDPPNQFNSYRNLQKNLCESQRTEKRIIYIGVNAAGQNKQKAGTQRIKTDERGKARKPACNASTKYRDGKRTLQRQAGRP